MPCFQDEDELATTILATYGAYDSLLINEIMALVMQHTSDQHPRRRGPCSVQVLLSFLMAIRTKIRTNKRGIDLGTDLFFLARVHPHGMKWTEERVT